MKGLYNYFREIVVGFWSIILGYSVTLNQLVKPIITVQYPRVKLEMDPAYRGHIELTKMLDEGHFCVACGTCVRACPSDVIKVQGIKSEAGSGKTGILFLIDYSRCSLCGICVDVCPVDALRFSMEYELAHYSRWDSVIDLHARFKEQKVRG
ncbi:MAG: NADH-quinone oxidoreductase subunit I [Candidatus Adiutricales bacterium]|jgi:NADH-quinone oxidoreductase subunit I